MGGLEGKIFLEGKIHKFDKDFNVLSNSLFLYLSLCVAIVTWDLLKELQWVKQDSYFAAKKVENVSSKY